ncbi:unnamed protein product [Parajaminaea phylloscopi]
MPRSFALLLFTLVALVAEVSCHARKHEDLKRLLCLQHDHGHGAQASHTRRNGPAHKDDFHIDGKKLPGVSELIGDVGDSWAGLLPISDDPKNNISYFFWLWAPQQSSGHDTLTLWLNGGPGCSSMVGMTTENGPFLVKSTAEGKLYVQRNLDSWNKAGWVLYVDQPAATGYSSAPGPDAANEQDIARDFEGFLKQLYKVFPELAPKKFYLTGESYAGMYIPYMVNRLVKNGNPFHIEGWGLVSGVLPELGCWGGDCTAYDFVYRNRNVMNISKEALHYLDVEASFRQVKNSVSDHLYYPPSPKLIYPPPTIWGGSHQYSWSVLDDAYSVAADVNPCFNPYHVSEKCSGDTSSGDEAWADWLNRPEWKKAIHANSSLTWYECAGNAFTGNGDQSVAPMVDDTFRNAVESVSKAFVWIGDLDFVVNGAGTLLGLQNSTWRGQRGFQKRPEAVMRDQHGNRQGVYHTERGVTLLHFYDAGHFIPMHQPHMSLKAHRVFLGQLAESALSEIK